LTAVDDADAAYSENVRGAASTPNAWKYYIGGILLLRDHDGNIIKLVAKKKMETGCPMVEKREGNMYWSDPGRE